MSLACSDCTHYRVSQPSPYQDGYCSHSLSEEEAGRAYYGLSCQNSSQLMCVTMRSSTELCGPNGRFYQHREQIVERV